MSRPMTDKEKMAHAELVHGLIAYECVACSVQVDRACPLCSGEGTYFSMSCEPCGRGDCPIGRRTQ